MNEDSKLPRVTVGMGTCGIKAGSGGVLAKLRTELGELTDVVLTHVGCNGLCSYEPLVEVKMPGRPMVTYCNMTPDKAVRVVREHLKGGKAVEEWILPVS